MFDYATHVTMDFNLCCDTQINSSKSIAQLFETVNTVGFDILIAYYN